MAVTSGYQCQILITSSPSVSASNVNLVDSGDHQTWNISTSSTQRYWDPSQLANFVVQTSTNGGSSWTTLTAAQYTINKFVSGQVFLTAGPLSGTPAVRMATVYYFPYSVYGVGKEWSLSTDAAMVDVSTFGSPWKGQIATQRFWSCKITGFWQDNTFLALQGNLMVVVLYTNSANLNRYEAFGWVKSDAVKDAVAGVVDEDLTIEGTGTMYYMTT
jgi:hypothetical protein